jgi:toxin YoeB
LKSEPREAVFQYEFIEDLKFWIQHDRKRALRVLKLILDVLRDPFEGFVRPESLKHPASGTWSRRISQEHRLVYLIRTMRIDFLQARCHYQPPFLHPSRFLSIRRLVTLYVVPVQHQDYSWTLIARLLV